MTDLTDIPDFLRRIPKSQKLPEQRPLNDAVAKMGEGRRDATNGRWRGGETASEDAEAGAAGTARGD